MLDAESGGGARAQPVGVDRTTACLTRPELAPLESLDGTVDVREAGVDVLENSDVAFHEAQIRVGRSFMNILQLDHGVGRRWTVAVFERDTYLLQACPLLLEESPRLVTLE
ncbi:MAG TPA: hypothetical protein VFA08_06295 [Actinomycetota bacterium]|nr:hypothetical protein [Actinomycetota bacterium]